MLNFLIFQERKSFCTMYSWLFIITILLAEVSGQDSGRIIINQNKMMLSNCIENHLRIYYQFGESYFIKPITELAARRFSETTRTMRNFDQNLSISSMNYVIRNYPTRSVETYCRNNCRRHLKML